MAVGFINSAIVALSNRFDSWGGNILNYNKLYRASNGMAIWLCVLIGCFLSILTVAADALPSD